MTLLGFLATKLLIASQPALIVVQLEDLGAREAMGDDAEDKTGDATGERIGEAIGEAIEDGTAEGIQEATMEPSAAALEWSSYLPQIAP
jgi:hypothetical protein